MNELFDNDFLERIRRMSISLNIKVSGGVGGNRKSRSKGASIEFSDYREYSTGDDFRRIDWNAYGRFEKLFIKLFMEEREAPVSIFIDASRSMKWGTPDKSVASRRLAASIGCMALFNLDSLSIHAVSNGPVSSATSLSGRQGFARMLNFLEKLEYGGETSLAGSIRDCRIRRENGASMIISDLFSQDSLEEAIKYLHYMKQQVFVFHILAPEEVKPGLESAVRVVDCETGETRDVVVTSDFLRAYAKACNRFIETARKTCMKSGAGYHLFKSDMPVEKVVRKVAGV